MNIKDNKHFKFIDLFAGIGGMRVPFEELGGECVFSSEIDKYARKSYSAMFEEEEKYISGDVSKIKASEIPHHDILLAGFPCQPFSRAGKKRGFNDTRGTAFSEIRRILKFHRPKAFLLENVPGLISNDNGKTLETILRVLKNELGYFVHDDGKVLNAKDFGLPQSRKRFYLVGFDKDLNFRYPEPTSQKVSIKDILDDEIKVNRKYVISSKLWKSHKKRKKRNELNGKGFGYKLSNPNDQYTRTLSHRYYKDGSEILIDRGKNKNPRMLSPQECSRLQGFPKKWENLPVSDTQAYRQFGNAVPVNVVRGIAKSILDAL